MIGIPVLANGDPLRRTFVIAGDARQFSNWCMYSQVNPRSRNVKYLAGVWDIRGYSDFDVVYTGRYAEHREFGALYQETSYYLALGEIGQIYRQFESADIEPNVVYPNTIRLIR